MSEEKALAWAEKNMRPDQYADECPYVASGWAIWQHWHGYEGDGCICKQVPASYAPFLVAKARGIKERGE